MFAVNYSKSYQIKLLKKLIEYNKGGNTAEIEKFLAFLEKNKLLFQGE